MTPFKDFKVTTSQPSSTVSWLRLTPSASTPTTRIIYLHGFTQQALVWLPAVLTNDSALESEITLVNLPGHGPRPTEVLDPQAFFHELSTLCEDAIVVGYSLGGRLALWWAMEHPSTARALVLLSTNIAELSESERRQREESDLTLSQSIAAMDAKSYREFLTTWSQQPLFGPRVLNETAFRLRSDARPPSVAQALSTFSLAHQPPGRAFLSSWNRPVLILFGEHDSKYADIAQSLSSLRHPQSRRVSIQGAYHDLLHDAPARTIKEVGNFVRALAPRPSSQ
jgi:pimeloyl-ACP methyl ester carboxylesterase